MTTIKSTFLPMSITPGVQPSTDKTALATPHYTFADKIRFRFGYPQKIGGWDAVQFNNSATILGKARSLFSAVISTALNTVLGTHKRLYSILGSSLTNVTPLSTTATTIANSLASDYATLGSNPIASTNGSAIITITDANAQYYIVGDTVTLSGATAFNGLTTGNLNTAHVIHTIVDTSHYTIITGGTANATGSGGGASVVRATGRISVTATAHGMSNGDRTKLAGAAATGGVLAADINAEFIVRNATTNAFDVMTTGTATSAVTGGGGASTTYQPQVASGAQDQAVGQGYGCGMYGVGLYGTALLSSTGLTYPRIWFIDRFGSDLIMTAGNQSGLYSWTGSNATAPALITNAPTAINYAFVSDNILITFGAGGTINRIFASDQGNMTNWTSSSTNQVFDYTINGAGQLTSHVSVNGQNLVFTSHQTYLFSYIGLPLVWQIQLLENNVGIIAPMARCAVQGTAYWMGQQNFYMWNGGNVQIIPANSQEQSTILNYVFQNINSAQLSKCFAWYNEQFSEVWFHYPSASSAECDRVARLCLLDMSWVPDTFDRTCAEYPNLTLGYPRLTDSSSILYEHEQGNDANGSAMQWQLTTNLRGGSNIFQRYQGMLPKDTTKLSSFIPDSTQTGDITVELMSYRFPQSSQTVNDNTYTVTPTTEIVPVQAAGRLWKYKLSGNQLGQEWMAGTWTEELQVSSPS